MRVSDFWNHVDIGAPDDCWPWTVGTTRYGLLWLDGKRVYAHRVAYELLVGPIPDGTELDHLCRNTRCVNPKHLDPVTHLVNCLRSSHPNVAAHHANQCRRGHPLVDPNVRYKKNGTRQCKACLGERQREWHLRSRVSA